MALVQHCLMANEAPLYQGHYNCETDLNHFSLNSLRNASFQFDDEDFISAKIRAKINYLKTVDKKKSKTYEKSSEYNNENKRISKTRPTSEDDSIISDQTLMIIFACLQARDSGETDLTTGDEEADKEVDSISSFSFQESRQSTYMDYEYEKHVRRKKYKNYWKNSDNFLDDFRLFLENREIQLNLLIYNFKGAEEPEVIEKLQCEQHLLRLLLENIEFLLVWKTVPWSYNLVNIWFEKQVEKTNITRKMEFKAEDLFVQLLSLLNVMCENYSDRNNVMDTIIKLQTINILSSMFPSFSYKQTGNFLRKTTITMMNQTRTKLEVFLFKKMIIIVKKKCGKMLVKQKIKIRQITKINESLSKRTMKITYKNQDFDMCFSDISELDLWFKMIKNEVDRKTTK